MEDKSNECKCSKWLWTVERWRVDWWISNVHLCVWSCRFLTLTLASWFWIFLVFSGLRQDDPCWWRFFLWPAGWYSIWSSLWSQMFFRFCLWCCDLDPFLIPYFSTPVFFFISQNFSKIQGSLLFPLWFQTWTILKPWHLFCAGTGSLALNKPLNKCFFFF